MGSKPKVSVIISTFDRPKLLPRALKSVLAQTFTDFECIVVHDADAVPPPSQTAFDETVGKDKRFRIIALGRHHGKDTAPKNKGIQESKGEYIAYLDDDNEFLPNHLEVLVNEIELADVDVVYGDMRVFDPKKPDEPQQAIAMDFNYQFLINRCFIDTSEVLHKREAVFTVGGWDETLPRFVDWNLWVRMAKAGLKFKRVPIYITKYWITPDNSAAKQPVRTWEDDKTGLMMFDPTWWSPAGCYVWGPWLGGKEPKPRVAIFMITYDRLEYTQRTIESLKKSTKYPYDLYVFDNGSTDGTKEFLETLAKTGELAWVESSPDNKGLTLGSNACIDAIMEHDYQLVGKVDNDVEFMTKGWLETFVDLWKRNHNLYMGPYPEGLVDHPGGAPRVGHSTMGPYWVEVVEHLSGFCAFIDARAYKDFRWSDQFLHGQQDSEASKAFRDKRYMPMILPQHRVCHLNTTDGQQREYPLYFERRKKEKQSTYGSDKA